MAKASITLHPKHGVNPTLGICSWCGKENREIGLLGYNKGKEAPRHSILSDEPCDACKAQMAKGITLICVNHANRRIAWCVVSEKGIKRVIESEALVNDILKARKTCVSVAGWHALHLPEIPQSVLDGH